MPTVRFARVGLALLVAALAGSTVLAQSRQANMTPHQSELGYLNGGFGEEQADLMRDMSAQFPIRLTFSRHSGTHNTDEFVADVRLRIVDATGRTVLDLAGQGPIFLLRLPEGTYSLEAERNGDVKTRRFDVVTGRQQSIALSWAG